ncbi:hypothetical protein R3P38DRAFT_3207003 [Favolaschia claudopus]|uniref:Protein kinase domain-containing protein n=1 Tax=Favolaschia claudopus TaxID=2862362 RepID=A0AAW0AM15_9AGAR
MHEWWPDRECTPHEFKRHKVLCLGGESVLDFLAEQAATQSGYMFRSRAAHSTLEGRGSSILCQIINEMIGSKTGHAIICTQVQYVMILLTDLLQLQISPVYAIRGSNTQAADAALLVLFYAHAALGAGTKYPRRSEVTAMHVTLPVFPTSVFQPYEGRDLSPDLVSVRSDVHSSNNEVTITYGRLVFLFFASTTLIAKTAHGPSANQRLLREYDVYHALRLWQGVAIPKLVGVFVTGDGRNTVLLLSYTGKALKAFSELNLSEKLELYYRLFRLHKSGVQHNDFEPRNVTMSSSGPFLIDFDHASLDHNCSGTSCLELLRAAEALGLDPPLAEQLRRLPSVYSSTVALILAVFGAWFSYVISPLLYNLLKQASM